MIKILSSLCAVILLVMGCAQVVPGQPIPRFDFLSRATVPVMVSEIQVTNTYTAPMASPNVDHLFNVTLGEAVKHWSDRRFSPQGSQGTLTIIVEEASVIEEPLLRTQGWRGIFTFDQAYRYKAKLVVSVSATNPDDLGSVATTRVTVEHNRTIGEYASVQDRDKAWTRLTEDTLHDLDLYLTKSMREKLPFLIRSAPLSY